MYLVGFPVVAERQGFRKAEAPEVFFYVFGDYKTFKIQFQCAVNIRFGVNSVGQDIKNENQYISKMDRAAQSIARTL
jgi:hypothetical protein